MFWRADSAAESVAFSPSIRWSLPERTSREFWSKIGKFFESLLTPIFAIEYFKCDFSSLLDSSYSKYTDENSINFFPSIIITFKKIDENDQADHKLKFRVDLEWAGSF